MFKSHTDETLEARPSWNFVSFVVNWFSRTYRETESRPPNLCLIYSALSAAFLCELCDELFASPLASHYNHAGSAVSARLLILCQIAAWPKPRCQRDYSGWRVGTQKAHRRVRRERPQRAQSRSNTDGEARFPFLDRCRATNRIRRT